jgi:hypothetical protein
MISRSAESALPKGNGDDQWCSSRRAARLAEADFARRDWRNSRAVLRTAGRRAMEQSVAEQCRRSVAGADAGPRHLSLSDAAGAELVLGIGACERPSATEILPESVNLSPWGPHPFGADGAGPSPSDEPAAAEDARRIAAERLRRGAWRPAAKPWKGAVFGPPPAHLDSAEYWGASISPPDASAQPSTHGFHLSPVPPAPSWEQVVPTGSPWSVAPRLPSPTAWGGDAISGVECYTSAGKLHCITPVEGGLPCRPTVFPTG